MFTTTVGRLLSELSEIKAVAQWQNALRQAIHAPGPDAGALALDANALVLLRATAPQGVPWRLFDHCAAVTRIYALFEKAIGDIVVEYLDLMPSIFSSYPDLAEPLRINHRTGIGQILQKWSAEKSLYSHLAEDAIAVGLADGLRGKPYTLLSDAFLVDSDNYRVDTINRVFSRVGLTDVFAGVRQCAPVKEFCATNLAGTETADSFLNEFVRKRNEVAHGAFYSVVGVDEIRNYADFAVLVAEALSGLLRKQLLIAGSQHACALMIGEVLAKWPDNVVGAEARAMCDIRTGDVLYAGKKYLNRVNVVSLQLAEVPHESIALVPGTQFGAKLSTKIPVGSQIYRWIGKT